MLRQVLGTCGRIKGKCYRISQGVLVCFSAQCAVTILSVTREAAKPHPWPWLSHFNRILCQFICVFCCYVFKSAQTMRCSVAQRLLPGVRSFAVGVMLASFYCMHPVCGLWDQGTCLTMTLDRPNLKQKYIVVLMLKQHESGNLIK